MRWTGPVLLASIVLAAAWLSAAARPSSAPGPDNDVRVDEMRKMPAGSNTDETDAMLGVVVPAREVWLAPAEFAKVATIDVIVGQHVVAGEILARMETRVDQAELKAAKAGAWAAFAEAQRMAVEDRRSLTRS